MPQNLPSDPSLERVLLEAAIVAEKAYREAAAHITRDTFTDGRHRIIWDALGALAAEGAVHDLVALRHWLLASGNLESAGGIAYVASIVDGAFAGANVPWYCGRLLELQEKRDIAEALERAAERAAATGEELDPVLAEVEEQVRAVYRARFDRLSGASRNAVLGDVLTDLEAAYRGEGETGVTYGLRALDAFLRPAAPGNLIVVGARTSIGKTAFALHMSAHAARSGKQVAFFSLEMLEAEVWKRIIFAASGIDSSIFSGGVASEAEWQRVAASFEEASKSPIHVHGPRTGNLAAIRAACDQLMKSAPLGLIVVDYLQIVRPEKGRGAHREQEVAEISRGLKALAGEYRVPVLTLSQINRRADEKEAPSLSDLRESGAIEQDADAVILLSVARPVDSVGTVLRANVAKQRNGRTDCAEIFFHKARQTFHDLTEETGASRAY